MHFRQVSWHLALSVRVIRVDVLVTRIDLKVINIIALVSMSLAKKPSNSMPIAYIDGHFR